METTRNKLTPYSKHFFDNLSNYLDTKLYFFGSIQRSDYFPNSSDIDVDIFTDNEPGTIMKIQNMLNIDRTAVHKFVYKLDSSNTVVYGHKVQYKDEHLATEFLIFNEKYKRDVIRDHCAKFVLPFYISYLLVILKFIYYKLHLVSRDLYVKLKRRLLNSNETPAEFIIIPKEY
jgi:predicted nucleotidyltransferase